MTSGGDYYFFMLWYFSSIFDAQNDTLVNIKLQSNQESKVELKAACPIGKNSF